MRLLIIRFRLTSSRRIRRPRLLDKSTDAVQKRTENLGVVRIGRQKLLQANDRLASKLALIRRRRDVTEAIGRTLGRAMTPSGIELRRTLGTHHAPTSSALST